MLEQMINNMLQAGLRINFLSSDFIQVTVDGSAVWWNGSTLEEVYAEAQEMNFVDSVGELELVCRTNKQNTGIA